MAGLAGPWTRAVWVDHTKGGVDPALFTFVKIAPDTRLRGVGRGIPKAPPNLTPKTVGFPSIRDARFLHCGSAWKRDPGSGVIGVEKGPLIPLV